MKRKIAIVAVIGIVLITIEIMVLVLGAMLMIVLSRGGAGLFWHVIGVSVCITLWNWTNMAIKGALKHIENWLRKE